MKQYYLGFWMKIVGLIMALEVSHSGLIFNKRWFLYFIAIVIMIIGDHIEGSAQVGDDDENGFGGNAAMQ